MQPTVTLTLTLAMIGRAGAQESGDERLRELERRVAEQAEELRVLQKTVALPPHGEAPAPPPANLVVPPEAAGAADPELEAPLAGYSEKNFFLRDRHSWFVLVPKGRLNVDAYYFPNRPDAPAGVIPNDAKDPRSSLRDTVFIRRARIGLAGTIARHVDFRVEAEFASLPAPGQYATLTDASITINYSKWIQLEAGQFYAPFTLENHTSENYTDFMEKAGPVRWALPTSREIGAQLLGAAPRNLARYWVGLFNGDGQNVKNLDNRPAVIGRAVIAPLALWSGHDKWMAEVWLGGSFWWQETNNLGGAAAPSTSGATAGDLAADTTQGGFGWFSSNYANGADAMKNPVRSHLAPDGRTVKYAFEANLPLTRRFGLRGEYVHQAIDLRRYDDTVVNGTPTRALGDPGHLAGWGAYAEAWAWLGGDVNADRPGLYATPHWNGYVTPPPPCWAVQLAAKYEHVEFDLSGLAARDPTVGHWRIDSFEVGASLWFTRHSRLAANYVLNYLGAGDGRAPAPAEQKNLFYQNSEHELLFRLAVSL